MNEVTYWKKKATAQILRCIAKSGNPTCSQILFLEKFFNKKVKEK